MPDDPSSDPPRHAPLDPPFDAPRGLDPDAPAVDLCASSDLTEGGRGWVFELLHRGEVQRAFALRQGGRVVAYLNRCAHVPVEMDWNPGEFLDADRRVIVCSIHGAEYEPADGRCVSGPCGRGRLMPVPVRDDGQRVAWYPSPDLQPLSFS